MRKMKSLRAVKKKLASARLELQAALELLESVASLDLHDQYPLHWRVDNLRWDCKYLEAEEERLTREAWQTGGDPIVMKVTKTA